MAGESARESARRQREKAERLLRAAERNERGADGEEATAEVLAGLPSETWTVLHDVRWPGRRFANVDHVVIGPAGVFVVDSKNWSGRLEVRDRVLRQNGYEQKPAVTGAAAAAQAVAALVPLLRADRVVPVLCFVREDDELTGWARGVRVCSTANLLDMLQSRPHVLEPSVVRQVALQLDAQLTAATSPNAPARRLTAVPPRPTPASRPAARSTAQSRARARRRKSAASDVVKLAVVADALYLAYLLVLPSVLER